MGIFKDCDRFLPDKGQIHTVNATESHYHTMLDDNLLHNLPSSAELPNSDDTSVDNELQNIIPN
ncbi:hypothetical protein NDI44_15385 [Trichocoleus sp. DQ-A3]|uniref:hypothetical protein n=1 Tax=Coleofasciculus sp. FACHB-125 TaxID=2692784 RepID=UPI0018EFFA38